MNVAVDLTRNDYMAFWSAAMLRIYKLGRLRGKVFVLNVVYWAFLGFIGVSFLIFYQSTNASNLVQLKIALAASILWLAYTLFIQQWERSMVAYASVSEDGTTLGRVIYAFNDDGILEETEKVKTTYTWKAISDIEESNEYIFIYTDVAKGLILPKRSLPTDQVSTIMSLLRTRLSRPRSEVEAS